MLWDGGSGETKTNKKTPKNKVGKQTLINQSDCLFRVCSLVQEIGKNILKTEEASAR